MGLLRFAVATPGGVELEKNVIFIVQNYLLVVVGHNDLNRAFLLLWNRLGLDAGVDLAVNEILDECAHVVVRKLLVLVKGKLLVLDGLLDREGGPFAVFEVQIAGMCAKGLGVNRGEADDPLVLLRKGLEFGSQFSALFWSLREDVGQWDTSLGTC